MYDVDVCTLSSLLTGLYVLYVVVITDSIGFCCIFLSLVTGFVCIVVVLITDSIGICCTFLSLLTGLYVLYVIVITDSIGIRCTFSPLITEFVCFVHFTHCIQYLCVRNYCSYSTVDLRSSLLRWDKVGLTRRHPK